MADPVKRTIEDLRANGAPDFFERDPSVLKATYKAQFEKVTGRTLYPAQTEMYLIELQAYAHSLLAEAAQTATLQNTAVFAEGVHLENRGASVSTFRLLAQPASTTLRFTLSAVRDVETAIAKGTRVASGNAVTFATDADLIIPAGALTGDVAATAEATGAAWNGLAVGTVKDILDPVAYVTSAANITVVSGGSDIEDAERFRLRVVNALFTVAKTGPKNGYREHALAVDPDIIDVAVVRPEPGKINIYPLMRTGLPSAELKAAVLAYLNPETLRPMGDEVTVLSPEPVDFDALLTVRSASAVTGLEAACRSAAVAAFAPYTQQLGSQVAPSVIISAVKAVSGVTDVEASGFAFTDLADHQFATLASLTISIQVRADG
ncbi:phage baseplate assembly protein [Agrobacterium vitis]|uniref:Phage baseplate assembly protein n=1 Tax=Agrobacterium vitis TaxID=373 RepID=A0ABD6GC64_AGRVI|nr:baseplate J/gp47 family protein [Agrobacterium vitis]MUO78136.1 phage baseplate assembly protein [Agrobacterium vitis]MUO94014.1 phage baseplate assembly protein [Agrobacterium vitis]MUP03532.1 phage baseplate assembly protein [Agrobacterium vitis]MVA91147.1 phage baseplate assembly protein [Agrobacterium vitis]MVB00917.1 phage baseplate assembly protein [Agrobacterium vitis]